MKRTIFDLENGQAEEGLTPWLQKFETIFFSQYLAAQQHTKTNKVNKKQEWCDLLGKARNADIPLPLPLSFAPVRCRPTLLWASLPPYLLRRGICNRRPLHLIPLNPFHHYPPFVTVLTPHNPNIYKHTTGPARQPLPLPQHTPRNPLACIRSTSSLMPSPSSSFHSTNIHFAVNHKALPNFS